MSQDSLFEEIWRQQDKEDPAHGGISKKRAKEVWDEAQRETDALFKSVEKKNRESSTKQ